MRKFDIKDIIKTKKFQNLNDRLIKSRKNWQKISIKVVTFPAPLSLLLLFIRRLFVFVSISDLFSLTMSLKVILLIAVPMFVICCAILLKYWDRFKKQPKQQRGHHKIERVPETVLTICPDQMSDNRKEAVKKMAKPIFICGDCWLLVFDFLAPSQLGLEIALISRRFDRIVDEHFKTRKWKLNNKLLIQSDIEENGTKKMQIVKSDGNPLPIPLNPLPNKIIGFSGIQIMYIDQNVIEFLRRFHRFFASCSTDLYIITGNDRISKFILLNIWPIFRFFIIRLRFNTIAFRCLRQLAPSFLSDSPSLRYVFFDDTFFPEFPPDESANASGGQAATKWLFTPRPDGLPKLLVCFVNSPVEQWSSMIELIKAAFYNASSPVTFRIRFLSSSPIDFILPFDLINEVTVEQLTLEIYGKDCWLDRCPIGWNERNWKNDWEEMSAQQNRIDIWIKDGGFDDGLLDDASPGPSDQQQK